MSQATRPEASPDEHRGGQVARAGAARWELQRLVRPLSRALVTGTAGPPPPRSRLAQLRRGPLRVLPAGFDFVLVVDVLVAWAIWGTTYSLLVSQDLTESPPYSPLRLGWIAAASAFPLLLRERYPLAAWRVATLAILTAAPTVEDLLPLPYTIGSVVMYGLCLYSVGARCDRDTALGVWVLSALMLLIIHPNSTILGAGLMSIPLLFGHAVRTRAGQEQEREEERAARAVLEERSRIARELHDVVAHHMSVIAIQAEAAPLRAPDEPESLKADLAEIRRTALEALAETRRIIGVLREDDGQSETAPQPDLDRLGDLVANAGAAGLSVRTLVRGTAAPVPQGVALSAYRIVQESLSNAMRHAPGSQVEVELSYQERPRALLVRVQNGAPPGGRPETPRDGARHGLIGMRQRADMLGGELMTGPTADGGFVVAAILPLDGV